MLIIGLTGGIACGKSTVANIFAEHAIPVLDADAISREIMSKGKPGYQLLKKLFGNNILQPDGQIDRNTVADIVFKDREIRRRLEVITLPLIRAKIDDFIKRHQRVNRQAVLVEAAMIIENNRQDFYSPLVVVGATKEEQIKRLQKRDGLNQMKALARIKSQMPLTEKRKYADYYIDNSQTKEETRKKVESLITLILRVNPISI